MTKQIACLSDLELRLIAAKVIYTLELDAPELFNAAVKRHGMTEAARQELLDKLNVKKYKKYWEVELI